MYDIIKASLPTQYPSKKGEKMEHNRMDIIKVMAWMEAMTIGYVNSHSSCSYSDELRKVRA